MRRAHKKTRTGCRTCKRRKIKCDEQWPTCKRCSDRGFECQRDPPKPPTSSSPDAPELRILDLELLYHFTSSTYATLAADHATREMWRTGFIRIALSCDYVMLSILSVAALHLEHMDPVRSEEMHSQAVTYHEEATRLAMRAMLFQDKDPNEKFLFSVLTIYYAFGSLSKSEEHHDRDSEVYPLWMTLIQGCRAFLGANSEDITAGCVSAMMPHVSTRYELRLQMPPNTYLQDLRCRIRSSVQEPDRLETYMAIIDELDLTFGVFFDTPGPFDLVDIFIWVIFAEALVPLLQRQEREALAVLAHFCMLLNRLPGQWWLGGWVDHLMTGIIHALGDQCLSWVSWPIHDIGRGEITMLQGKGLWHELETEDWSRVTANSD